MTRLLFKHSNIITASKHNKPHLYFSFSPVLHNLQRHRYFATRLANSSSMDTTKCANRKCSALHDAKPFKPTLCTECQAAHVAKKELEKNSQQMSKKTLPIENNQHAPPPVTKVENRQGTILVPKYSNNGQVILDERASILRYFALRVAASESSNDATEHDLATSRISELHKRIRNAELRLQSLEASRKVIRDDLGTLKLDLARKQVLSYKLVTVPGDYYDRSLEARAQLLRCHPHQLCKSIVFENTMAQHEDCHDRSNARYYLVIVQYAAKFDAEMLRDVIQALRKPDEGRLPRKRFHFQLAPEDVNARITGYAHNAVSPFGLMNSIPIVICSRCLSITPPFLFLGGGKVDVKLGLSVTDLVAALDPIVGNVSHLREQ